MVLDKVAYQTQINYQMSTTNMSFLNMHNYLKRIGITNNKFFLAIFDVGLVGIDPRDPRLNNQIKIRILRECTQNFWYFIREVVLIPDQGGQTGGGKRYELHRGNLAMNYGFVFNWCMYVEFPRQNGKTISAVIWYLWCFNFGTTNSEFMFINKSFDDSKLNLSRLKDIRDTLPTYLRMTDMVGPDGKAIKAKNSVETLEHTVNGNKIKTLASANSEIKANVLGRGCTQPFQWYDEHAFIPYVDLVYLSATPAYNTASHNARNNRKPYGILITTTPGDLTTRSGKESYKVRNDATQFTERFYDKSIADMNHILSLNTNSPFVHIIFTYQQLGKDQKWFAELCKTMQMSWDAIRREVMLEWAKASSNSPFTKEELNQVRQWISKEPVAQIEIRGHFINIYTQYSSMALTMYPALIGVDVSGGYMRDASAISIVDSRTTDFIGELNCNWITQDELAAVIFELVTKYLPRSVVNIERNGGFGSAVLNRLVKSSIKRNLYYEIKEHVLEEKFNYGGTINRSKQKVICYGTDNTPKTRNMLMDILRQRMAYHKNLFRSPTIMNELDGLELGKNGRIDHSSQTHDDQIFSYLMALYIWYEGKNINQWNIQKRELTTDNDLEESIVTIQNQEYNIAKDILNSGNDEVNKQLAQLDAKSMTFEQFSVQQYEKDNAARMAYLQTDEVARRAYCKQNALDYEEFTSTANEGQFRIPDKVFQDFYK